MLLAIESTTAEVAVALADGSGTLAACTIRPDRRHVETLHPAIEAVCTLAGMPLGSLVALVVDVGPGLFTGIRVGVAAAKGLALALAVPVVACTSLEVLARAARHCGPVLPVADLRRGVLAWDLSAAVPELGHAVGGANPGAAVGTFDELASALVALDREVLLVGDGASRHGEEIAAAVRARGGKAPRLAGDALGSPPVRALAALGVERYAAGRAVSAVEVAPVYLRPPDARANFTSRPAQVPPAGGEARS